MITLLKKLFIKEVVKSKSCCAHPWHYKSDGRFIKKAVLRR